MTRNSLDQLKSLVAAAMALPPDQRAAFVAAHSAPDDVKDEALRLIQARSRTPTLLDSDSPVCARPAPANRTIGAYQLLEAIGQGGSATVYRARRTNDSFGQLVAVKVFDRAVTSPEGRSRLAREAQSLARCEHPYIVRMIEAGQTADGVAYLVTELVEGLPLDQAARDLTTTQRLDLFLKITEAVAHAHRNLLVHRDLKPSNILVGSDQRPRLLDFGIALLLDETDRWTSTGFDRMTPRYASPEQVRREKQITTQTDIYTLGVLLYELMCGRSPYGEDALPHLVALRIERGEILPPPRGAMDPDLEAIAGKAMSRQPEDRYRTVEELSQDVQRFLARQPVLARRPSAWYLAAKLVRRQPLATALLAILLTVLLVSAVVLQRQYDVARRRSREIGELAGSLMHNLGRDLWLIPGTFRHSAIIYEYQVTYLTRLLQDNPDDYPLKRNLISALFYHGMAQGDPESVNLGRLDEAQRIFSRALRLAEETYQATGGDEELIDVCHALNYLGRQDRERGNHAAADRRFAECEARLGGRLRQPPTGPVDAWLVLAFSKSLRALSAASTGDRAAFHRQIGEALAIRRERARLLDGANRMRHGRGLSFTLAYAAEGALTLDEPQLALPWAEAGIAIERGEFERDHISTARYFLAVHLRQSALARARLRDDTRALRDAQEAVEHFRRLLDEEPLSARYDRGLTMAYAAHAEVEERAGHRAEALRLRGLQLPLAERCSAREPQSEPVRVLLEQNRSALRRLTTPEPALRPVAP